MAIFVGHAHAAVQLDGVLADEAAGAGRSAPWRRRPPWRARRRLVELERRPYRSSRSTARAAMNMSTMRCCSTWNWPIGWPNCLRCLVYSSGALMQLGAGRPGLGAERRRSPRPSPSRPAAGPRPRRPISASAGTLDVLEDRSPRRAGRRRSDSRASTTPLAALSTRNTETPLASRWPPPVRAVTIRWVAQGAPTTTALWPFST